MPAIYTHYTLAQDVYRTLDKKISHKIIDSTNTYYLFAQSFDMLNLVKVNNKHIMGLCHNNNVNLYFKNIITYIKDNKLYYNSELLAYLYGSLCHYILDSTIHPYVFYYTGVYHNNKETQKYKGMHTKMEYMLDAIIYEQRNHKSINKAKLSKLFPKFKFNNTLNNCLDYTFKNTFNLDNMSKLLNIAHNRYRFGIKYYMTDHTGIKTNILKLVDKTKLIKTMELHYYTYHIKKLDNYYLNLEHNLWYYPLDKTLSYHYSFYDLYDIALERARNLITSLDYALDKTEEDINKVLDQIGDNKYSTGLPCTKKGAMKYFKY